MNRIIIFHHNDMDGRSAGTIARNYFINHEGYLFEEFDFHELDYSFFDIESLITKDDIVVFVDYSFTEATKSIIDKAIEIIDRNNLYWIDHHASSINLSEKYGYLKEVKGIRNSDYCGAYLTMKYFNYNLDTGEYRKTDYLKLIDDYDCWKNKMLPNSSYFKLFIDSIPVEKQRPSEAHNIYDRIETGGIDLKDIIEKGELLYNYEMQEMKSYRDQFSFEGKINGIKCLCVNRIKNSWLFGDKINNYPMVCSFVFNGDKYRYSLYSADPNVDVSKIAESYGGGGHKGAAGFMSDNFIIEVENKGE